MLQYSADIMPEEIKPEKKLMKNIYAFDFFAIVGSFALGQATKMFVASALQWPYIMGCLVIGIVLTRQSKTNPKKRVWQAVEFFVTRPTETYLSISVDSEPMQENRKVKDGI